MWNPQIKPFRLKTRFKIIGGLGILCVALGIILGLIRISPEKYLGKENISETTAPAFLKVKEPLAVPGTWILDLGVLSLNTNQHYQIDLDLKNFRKTEIYFQYEGGVKSKRLEILPGAERKTYSGVIKVVEGEGKIPVTVGVQIYRGGPAEVEIRKIQIRTLDRAYYVRRDFVRIGGAVAWTVAGILIGYWGLQWGPNPKLAASLPVSGLWFRRHPAVTLLGFICVLLVILDGFFGWFFVPQLPGKQSDRYHHGLRRNFSGLYEWGGERFWIKTNSLGMKAPQVEEIPLVSDRYRTVFIGDSFTEGKGLGFEQTWVGIIANLWRSRGIEVYNAGVSSFSPHLYELRVRDLVEWEGFRFAELVVAIDLSDVQDELLYQEVKQVVDRSWMSSMRNWWKKYVRDYSFIGYHFGKISWVDPGINLKSKPELVAVADGGLPRSSVSTPETPSKIGAYFDLWPSEKAFYAERGEWTRNPEIYERWGRLGSELEIYYMDRLFRFCQEKGIRLSIMIYPWKQQIEDRRLDCPHVKMWEEFCRQRGVKLVNLYPPFLRERASGPVKDRFFIDGDVHWNVEGNRFVAEEALKEMERQGIGVLNQKETR